MYTNDQLKWSSIFLTYNKYSNMYVVIYIYYNLFLLIKKLEIIKFYLPILIWGYL